MLKQCFGLPVTKKLLGSGRAVLHVCTPDASVNHYWSVALMYWTPYRPTFQELKWVATPPWLVAPTLTLHVQAPWHKANRHIDTMKF
eukprot:6491845-Amphidinium_carterae.2